MQQISLQSKVFAYFPPGVEKSSLKFQSLGCVISELNAEGRHITNKALILKLIEKLEMTTDVIMLDVYRHLLEVIIGSTPDDA
ncbi:biofilm development regulator YmgB/AriR family protein [Erwinia piriflorinigrans]|uniref:Regulatory protein ariR n=1 Tax=Erwinia piriflorinigrans CFBP 5888 TaxID=1161919 RepID=V5Z737_9GAMM|nr:biofilm development regulator YmgB/AriR family protein [Erwinia piriflorinigrans]CCG87053.1 Regulatory protein ariR [Erwinia piriflorinigrans CFBP 5888]